MTEHFTDRFSDRSRRVVVLAQEEARRLGHSSTGTDHLLLGLNGEEHGIPAQVLASRGISPAVIRAQVEERNRAGWLRRTLARNPPPAGALPLTPQAKKALELSHREALQFHHDYIAPEHILVALLRVDEAVLVGLEIDRETLRSEVIERIRHRPVGPQFVTSGASAPRGSPRTGGQQWRISVSDGRWNGSIRPFNGEGRRAEPELPSHGRGHWFEISIAHLRAFSWNKAEQK